MLLKNKNAIIYGAGGAIGSAVAESFSREGAKLFLAGRNPAKLKALRDKILDAGGTAEIAEVDALNHEAVTAHADGVAAKAGSIDVALNAVGIFHIQGKPFAELSLEEYAHPITAYTRTHFITAKAVAKHMMKQSSGVILTLSTPGGLLPGPGFMGFGVACAAIESLSRHLAGELGSFGIRVICLRPDAIPEALEANSHSKDVFNESAQRAGYTIENMLAEHARTGTLLKRLPTLKQVADVAAFMASDRASAMTGTVANLTCGSIVD